MNAKKQTGMKLELRKARRDQSSGEVPECRMPMEKLQAAMPSVHAANQRLIGFVGCARKIKNASASSMKVTTISDAGTMASLGRSKYQGHVSTTNAVTVDERVPHASSPGNIGNIIKIALWIRFVEIDGWWDNAVPNGQTRGHDLHSCGRS